MQQVGGADYLLTAVYGFKDSWYTAPSFSTFLCAGTHFEPLLKVKKKKKGELSKKETKQKKNPRAQNNVIDE